MKDATSPYLLITYEFDSLLALTRGIEGVDRQSLANRQILTKLDRSTFRSYDQSDPAVRTGTYCW
jgi:hypothetical protein